MPQLVPFFFVNQVIFTLIILSIIFYTFSKYILPWFGRLFIIRLFINRL
nr:ATP synthase F0 subunit 8 [Gymnascella aurantiaca]WMB97486.1 ATP synthase F0 subunit 8 [Gymnascella aurantiaca]